jgi:O-antigen/teichoic acid export membrane protein
MSFLSSILKHSSQSVAAGMISAVGSFASSVLIARFLGVEGTATVSMALWIVFLTNIISDVGITGTLARHVAECTGPDGEADARRLASYGLRALFLAILAGQLLGGGFLWLYWDDIQTKYASGPHEALLFCVLIMICLAAHMLNSFAYQYLRGLREFRRITIYSLAGSVVQMLAVIAGSLAYGALGALSAYILFSLPMIFALRGVRLFGHIDVPPAAPRMRSYALSFYLAVLVSPLLWVRADLLIVDQILGAEAVGLFAAAATMAALLIHVCQMICNALLPNIVNSADGDRENFEKVSRIAVRLALTLLVPACLIAAAVAPETITAVFGPDFAAGRTTAAVLCLSTAGSALTLVMASVINAGDSNRALVLNGLAGAALTLVLGVGLVLALGLVGAALGRLAAQGIVGILNIGSANHKVRGLVTSGWLLRVMAAGLAGAAAAEGVGWIIGEGLVGVFLSLAAGGLAFLIAASLLLPLTSQERERLADLLAERPTILRRPANWLLSMGRME